MIFRRLKYLSLFVISFLFGFGCSGAGNNDDSSGFRNIDFKQAMEMIDSPEPPVIVDVRTPGEYNNELGHIHGSLLIPMQETEDSMGVYEGFRGKRIILVCRTGRRSGIVAGELVKRGFKDVYNLSGGMTGWNEKGGKVERDSG